MVSKAKRKNSGITGNVGKKISNHSSINGKLVIVKKMLITRTRASMDTVINGKHGKKQFELLVVGGKLGIKSLKNTLRDTYSVLVQIGICICRICIVARA